MLFPRCASDCRPGQVDPRGAPSGVCRRWWQGSAPPPAPSHAAPVAAFAAAADGGRAGHSEGGLQPHPAERVAGEGDGTCCRRCMGQLLPACSLHSQGCWRRRQRRLCQRPFCSGCCAGLAPRHGCPALPSWRTLLQPFTLGGEHSGEGSRDDKALRRAKVGACWGGQGGSGLSCHAWHACMLLQGCFPPSCLCRADSMVATMMIACALGFLPAALPAADAVSGAGRRPRHSQQRQPRK